ncbi:hypothetical protein K1719_016841 [Acacia pycnantha]|nr:hypothetical protein K1719_028896 [Acacia pycnantha]KAI9112318.1 hypothetical protein K1719_016841 [Acacia pycnantha]
MSSDSDLMGRPTNVPKRSATTTIRSAKYKSWKRIFFKQCPRPDGKQRKELSRELGLEPQQVLVAKQAHPNEGEVGLHIKKKVSLWSSDWSDGEFGEFERTEREVRGKVNHREESECADRPSDDRERVESGKERRSGDNRI